MKKIIYGGLIACVIGVAASFGLLDATFSYDDISGQEYHVSLKKAVDIFEEEYQEHQITHIEFAIPTKSKQLTNTAYEYIIYSPKQVVAINPVSGKTTKVASGKQNKTRKSFNVDTIKKIKNPQIVMKEAIAKTGKAHSKAKQWEITEKNGQLIYEVQILDADYSQKIQINA